MIRSVAVLGAGVMGAQIAAHFANAGVPALLLDLSAEAAAAGLARARALKPDPFFSLDTWKLIRTASFDAGLPQVRGADWVIEAVVEQLEAKRTLLERVDDARRPGTIVSSNTSGIPISLLAEGRSDDFRRHWLGTHFFNPPRYLPLLELISTPETSPDLVRTVWTFADHRLGKGVVQAKDTPNFIGNHIGLYALLRILDRVAAGAYSIEEVDAITGPPLGRPKSATFRTLDIAGLDVVGNVVGNLRERLGDDARRDWELPDFVVRMIERKLLGEKTGQGFYKRVPAAGGGTEILTLDPATLEYRPRQAVRLPALDAAAATSDLGARVKALFDGRERVGQFLRETLAPTLAYTGAVAPEIAYSRHDVDRVMRWGFGWELGPFELMQAIGPEHVLDAARDVRPDLLERRSVFAAAPAPVAPPAVPADEAYRGQLILGMARRTGMVVRSNAGASLVDLGDGVLCVEFHSKMNAIGGDALEMLQAGVREASQRFRALVVGSEAPHFSAGANLMMLLLEAREENWDDIDAMVRAFQGATMALRYADVPVVAAPAGLALGGGCEIALHADRVQAAAEAYLGLVETGVGLIPAGGGTKEMVARAVENRPGGAGDLLPLVQPAFETMAFAKTSTSGPDAFRLGYLRATDGVTMNRERLLAEAKAEALHRADGYRPPLPRPAIPVGGDTVLAPLKLGIHLARRAGHISDHDALVATRLATVVAGGMLPHAATVSEQRLLDLEREAFLSLIGERKTQDRIQHTLETGKPLRN